MKTALNLNEGEGVVVLSDREKGIENALAALLPRAAHSYCVYHIQKNVKVHFHTSLEGLLFRAAKAPDEGSFLRAMAEMKRVNIAAGEYVERIDKAKWARAFFPRRRYGQVTSNILESMNWWLDEVRHLDPIGMFTTFIRKLNVLFEKRRLEHSSLPPSALPEKPAELFEGSLEQARRLAVHPNTRTLFQVQRLNDPGKLRKVDLAAPSCSCGFFAEHGVPCRHICAAALHRGLNPRRFIYPALVNNALVSTYPGVVITVDTNGLPDDGLLPPVATKRRGRPKEKRYVSSAERRPKRTVTCRNCLRPGHNARSCKHRPT